MSDELIRTTLGDLKYLQREWHASVDDDLVRMTSGILRRLLVDDGGTYGKAWRAAGLVGEPTVMAPRIEGLLERGKDRRLLFALAGGADFAGGMRAGCYTEWKPILVDPNNLPPGEVMPSEAWNGYEWGLRKFVHSCGMFAEGRKVSRAEIIKFACNKLGGVHLDAADDPKKPIQGIIRRTERNGRLGGKMPAWFEVLSIGQHLSKSSATQRFIEAAEALLGSPDDAR